MCLPYSLHLVGLRTSDRACHALPGTARGAAWHQGQLSAMVPGHGQGMFLVKQHICSLGALGTALQMAQVHHRDHQPKSSCSLACRSDSEEWEPSQHRTSRGAARSSGVKAAAKGATQPASAASPSIDKPRHAQQSLQKQRSMQVQVQAVSLRAWAAGTLSGKPAASCHSLAVPTWAPGAALYVGSTPLPACG